VSSQEISEAERGEVVDILPIALRAYTEKAEDAKTGNRKGVRRRTAGPSEWALCFDTETTTDAAQRFRFGTYQIRRRNELYERGLFYDHRALCDDERRLIHAYAADRNITLRSVADFIEKVFFGIGYDYRAVIVGFNLPFDIARLALRWGAARLDMRDGFSFCLTPNKRRPHVRIKHISRRLALTQFAAAPQQRTWRSEFRRNEQAPIRRGFFPDVKTIAAAMLARSFSLGELAKFLATPSQKESPEKHGGPLTEQYLDYAMQDTQVTWECFEVLAARYADYKLSRTPLHQIFSEASLGKALMREMGIRPWRQVQPNFRRALLGTIWSTYLGGRAEVNIRRLVTRVRHCDFLSMYTTICVLMGLWEFMRADGIESYDATSEVTELLATVNLDVLQRRPTWRKLVAIVEVMPDGEVYPVRAPYGLDGQYTIGLNHIRKGPPIWLTLADCIVAKLHTGRTPKVISAVGFVSRGIQRGLKPVSIGGSSEYRIDPRREDFFKRLIELRHTIKERRDAATGPERERLDVEQNQLKILASSTSYGIYAEVNVSSRPEPVPVVCFGSTGEPYQAKARQTENPGAYYHPLMATLITAGARLMLSIAERVAAQEGFDWVFCDTDSMALAKPADMPDAEFNARVDRVQQWFVPLNPYAFGGPLLQTEKYNYRLRKGKPTKELEPLFCVAVSSKRYVLFNLDSKGRPVLRKASAHGLGHLLEPPRYRSPRGIPAPKTELFDIGVRRWEYDLWYRIALAAVEGHPDTVDFSGFKSFDQPAVSRYSVTTPELLKLFDKYNEGRPPHDQVRPFNFLLAFQAKAEPRSEIKEQDPIRRTPRQARMPHPVAPYAADLADAINHCFDRETGEPVGAQSLKTYREVLSNYHLHPESKFLDADWTDRGKVRRRHVEVTGIVNIGKEANELEEQFYLGADPEALPEYGMAPRTRSAVIDRITAAAGRFGRHRLAEGAGVSPGALAPILAGRSKPRGATVRKLLAWISAQEAVEGGQVAIGPALVRARAEAERIGLRRLAAELGVDAANLSKMLAGKRRLSRRVAQRLAPDGGQPLGGVGALAGSAPDQGYE
jgi:transcriptional regulator with XRE-family HTH domain